LNILAHGGHKAGPAGYEFRLILCKEDAIDKAEKVDGKNLIKAIVPDKAGSIPTVISLSACDSGNTGNTIVPSGSLVYQLHNAGIPCVFASQFPLTQQGSVKLVKTLYHQLVNACDPRVALYKTRIALKEDQNHDWASLVAYARFPKDINEQLQDTNLKMLFSSMRVTNAWVDHVFKFKEKIEPDKKEQALKQLEARLDKSINALSRFLKEENKKESTLANKLLRAEHLGLLGSAYKRKAEYFFRLIEFNPEKRPDLISQSIEALEKAKEFYNCGLEADSENHWTTMQYLSVKAVVEGSLKDENELWYVTKHMAQKNEKNPGNEGDRIWAWGTLAELYLLKPLTVPDNFFDEEIKSAAAIAKEYMTKMANAGAEYNPAKESTARQFERYINWWPDIFPNTYRKEVKDLAIEIRNILPSLDDLLQSPDH
jgi:hypothetical protein